LQGVKYLLFLNVLGIEMVELPVTKKEAKAIDDTVRANNLIAQNLPIVLNQKLSQQPQSTLPFSGPQPQDRARLVAISTQSQEANPVEKREMEGITQRLGITGPISVISVRIKEAQEAVKEGFRFGESAVNGKADSNIVRKIKPDYIPIAMIAADTYILEQSRNQGWTTEQRNTVLGDAARAAREAGVSQNVLNSALQSAAISSGYSPQEANEMANQSFANASHMVGEMSLDASQRLSHDAALANLQQADDLARKLIKESENGKYVDPSLLAEAKAIEEAKEKGASADTLSGDQTFMKSFAEQANIERQAMLSAVPILITGQERASTVHVAMEDYAILRAYRKALTQPRNA